jgi:SRSO17 transposase
VDIETLRGLRTQLDDFLGKFDGSFRSPEAKQHLATYVSGQLGPLQRKSMEPIALEAGVPPRTLQQFMGLLSWDQESLCCTQRKLVADEHGDPDAIGIIDGTDYRKKGDKTVGVQRQYCGEVGKVENCVATIQLDYVGRGGFHTLIDADLYLPESWAKDRARCTAAGVPETVGYRAKWRIALALLARSLGDGVPLRWITADEDYGRIPDFQKGVELLGLLYVLEVPKSVEGWTPNGLRRRRHNTRVESLFKRGGPSWKTYHVKDTTVGPLVWRARATRFVPTWDRAKELWLVIAESVLTGETKYFLSNASAATPIATLMTVAFSRWNVERSFEDAKQEVGLGHFEVRTYQALQRHLAISMLSLLFLARATHVLRDEKKRSLVAPAGQGGRRSSA